ncbi:MAG: iodotyrosine deiodinase [Myxococcota bacterium]|jgi:iodotyrosine deiodinase
MGFETINHIPYVPNDPEAAGLRFLNVMGQRRTVRDFSERDIAAEVIERLVRTACTAPSGANKQPWRFVCVRDPEIKRQIREAAEAEERAFYEERATAEWLADLAPLGTDANKAFLEVAPWLIVVFRLSRNDDGGQVYYGTESVGLACGLLLAAAQEAGLATLTHTPSPMGFLSRVLERPASEKPFLLIPVGYPAEPCEVPAHAVTRKPLEQVMLIR